MAIIINSNLVSTEIPVKIGKLEYKLDSSDSTFEKIQKSLTEIESLDTNLIDESAYKIVSRKGFEVLFGEGCYEDIYEQTPSGIRTYSILVAILTEAQKELSEAGFKHLTTQDKAKQYIRHKKQHNKNRR